MHKYTLSSLTPPSEMPVDPPSVFRSIETAASIHPTMRREAQYKTTMSQAPAVVWEKLQ